LTGETERSEQQLILADLMSPEPQVRLLYTTPEKVVLISPFNQQPISSYLRF
jgi:hypothetical protein